MEKTNNNQISTLSKSQLFLSSSINTVWAIGTSAATNINDDIIAPPQMNGAIIAD